MLPPLLPVFFLQLNRILIYNQDDADLQTNNQMISAIRPLLKEMYKNKEIVNLLHEYRSISMEEYDSSYNDILNYLKNDGEISSNTMSKSEEILKQLDSLLCLFVNNH